MSVKAADISELTAAALWCRRFGHSWVNYAPARKDSAVKGYAFALKCRNDCGTLRLFQWTRRGGCTGAGYRYADYYLAAFPVDAAARADIELQALIEAGILPAGTTRA